jgi:dihydroorotate dehydrogenase
MSFFEKIKPLIYKTDPELAHNLAELALSTARRCPLFFNPLIQRNFIDDPILNQKIWNLEFKNPIGVAAGFDKHAKNDIGVACTGFWVGRSGSRYSKASTR